MDTDKILVRIARLKAAAFYVCMFMQTFFLLLVMGYMAFIGIWPSVSAMGIWALYVVAYILDARLVGRGKAFARALFYFAFAVIVLSDLAFIVSYSAGAVSNNMVPMDIMAMLIILAAMAVTVTFEAMALSGRLKIGAENKLAKKNAEDARGSKSRGGDVFVGTVVEEKKRKIILPSIVSFLLIGVFATLLLTVRTSVSMPASPISDEFEYTIVGQEITITKFNAVPTVHIPDYIQGLPVTEISIGAAKGNTALESLYIGTNVKVIHSGAFEYCTSLKTVNFMDAQALEQIDSYAFANCTELYKVEFENHNGGKLRAIADYTFEGCTALSEITLPEGVESLGYAAFAGCERLTGVIMPSTITVIGSRAFDGCVSLTDVQFDYTAIENIGIASFRGCTQLSNVDFYGSAISTIGDQAFEGCTALTGVYFGNAATTLRSIGDSAFVGCTNLSEFDLSNQSKLESIGKGAFSYCSSLESFVIPKSTLYIGLAAFFYCDALTSVKFENTTNWQLINETAGSVLPVSVDDPEMNASNLRYDSTPYYWMRDNVSKGLEYTLSEDGSYYIVSGLGTFTGSELVIPAEHEGKPVREIGDTAFSEYWNVTSLTLPEGITTIGNWSFQSCTNLKTVRIPDSIEKIGVMAFSNCTNLEFNTYDNGKYIGNYDNPYAVFFEASSDGIAECVIHPDTKVIYAYAFWHCTALEEISIPNGVRGISGWAFEKCTGITGIDIPDSVVSIEGSAFASCTALTSINVSGANSHYTTVDGNLYTADEKTLVSYAVGKPSTSFDIPSGVTEISSNAFGCSKTLTSVKIPATVKVINKNAFYDCTALTDIYYTGTEAEWNAISIDSSENDALESATKHYEVV